MNRFLPIDLLLHHILVKLDLNDLYCLASVSKEDAKLIEYFRKNRIMFIEDGDNELPLQSHLMAYKCFNDTPFIAPIVAYPIMRMFNHNFYRDDTRLVMPHPNELFDENMCQFKNNENFSLTLPIHFIRNTRKLLALSDSSIVKHNTTTRLITIQYFNGQWKYTYSLQGHYYVYDRNQCKWI